MVASLTVSLLSQRKTVNVKEVRAALSIRFCPKKGKIKEKGRGMLLGSEGTCDILNSEFGCVIPPGPWGILQCISPQGSHYCLMCLRLDMGRAVLLVQNLDPPGHEASNLPQA